MTKKQKEYTTNKQNKTKFKQKFVPFGSYQKKEKQKKRKAKKQREKSKNILKKKKKERKSSV